MLYLGLTCHNGHISAFRSEICHKCHSIFIIGVIDVIDVRESSPSGPRSSHLTLPLPCKLHFLPNYTYDSYGQFYYLSNSSKNIRLPMDSKLQKEDAMWHRISSLCGPHNLHASPCSIATSIFSCINLFSFFIKYLFHSNVQALFIFPIIPNPKASTPTLGN